MVSNLASIYCGSLEPGLTKTNCETKKTVLVLDYSSRDMLNFDFFKK